MRTIRRVAVVLAALALSMAATSVAVLADDHHDPEEFCDADNRAALSALRTEAETDPGLFALLAECFDHTIVEACGELDIIVTEHPGMDRGWVYKAVWVADGVIVDPDDAEDFPATFDEGDGGGTVEVTWYLVGPESNYLRDSPLPNYWDGFGETITVDTLCAATDDDGDEDDTEVAGVVLEQDDADDTEVAGEQLARTGGDPALLALLALGLLMVGSATVALSRR